MTPLLILGLIFLALSVGGFALIDDGTRVWGRFSSELTASTDSRLQRLFVFANARQLLAGHLFLLLVIPMLLVMLFDVAWVVVAGVSAVLIVTPQLLLGFLAVRRRRLINQSLPDALARLAGAMRAGLALPSALQALVDEDDGPLAQELSLLLREHRIGVRLEDALDNLAERIQSEEVDLFVSAVIIAQDVGGNLAEILSRLSDTIRRKLEMEGKIRALTAQGVLQGRIVTALPIMILMILLHLEPEATWPIFSSLLGWCFLGVIASMLLIGYLAIRKIVRITI